MHMVGSSLVFWISSILEESIHGYMDKLYEQNGTENEMPILHGSFEHHKKCCEKTLFHIDNIIPYFYPFSIEFNIILASIWYIIWTNVGNNNKKHSLQLQTIREEICQDKNTGQPDIVYHSNLSINIDCHASNFGFFCGLFALLVTLITIIIFFTIKPDQFSNFGLALFTAQSIFLIVPCTVASIFTFKKMKLLNVSKQLDSPHTSMEDFLLVIPLPFYYIHHLLSIYSELIRNELFLNNILISICYAINLVQITLQTILIIDGIRRCSNERQLRYIKPGKQLITFSIIINISLWILVTFEIKYVDKFHSMAEQYGKFIWMLVLDTCLPLMLFYRFHSSVSLSNMWKHCYEKD